MLCERIKFSFVIFLTHVLGPFKIHSCGFLLQFNENSCFIAMFCDEKDQHFFCVFSRYFTHYLSNMISSTITFYSYFRTVGIKFL